MNIMLHKVAGGGAWVYDSTEKTYSLTIDDVVVAIIDANGNLIIKGRNLKI